VRVAVLAVVGALVLAACFGDDTPVVQTEPARAGTVSETVAAPARVDAAARQDVVATVPGTVAGIDVDDGGPVDAGQVVVRLASEQVDLARDQAAAAQQAAGGGPAVRVPGGGAGTRQATADAVRRLDESAAPQIAEARAHAATIEDPDQRAAAEAAIDAAEAGYLSTRESLLAAGEAVAAQQDAAARALGEALQSTLAQVSAPQRAQAAAAAAAAEAQAAGLNLHAPFAGTVQLAAGAAADGAGLALPPDLPFGLGGFDAGGAGAGGGTLRVGAPVAPGQVLFTVFDLSALYVTADVDEFDAAAVAVGQRAAVLVDAFPDVEFEGIVEGLRVEAAATGTGGVGYPARIRLIGPTEPGDAGDAAFAGLRVGMTASAEIATRTVDADLVVPSRALLRRDGETVVFVVRDDTAVQVAVQVLALGEDLAAVDGGLEAGEPVVARGFEGLEDATAVRAEP
jgi:multidrug efflux pump subunit AcrA (membrane-fusion protein)